MEKSHKAIAMFLLTLLLASSSLVIASYLGYFPNNVGLGIANANVNYPLELSAYATPTSIRVNPPAFLDANVTPPPVNNTAPLPYNANATRNHAGGGTGSFQTSIPTQPSPDAGPDGLVQSNYADATSNYVTSLSVSLSSVTEGDIVVAMVNDEGGPKTITITISDSRVGSSANWKTPVNVNDGTITVSQISYGTAQTSGADTVTTTFSQQTRYVVLSVWDINGYSASNPVTTKNSNDGSSFSVPSVNIASNSFTLAGVAADSAGTWSGTSGFSLTSGTDWGYEYTLSPPSSTTASMSATGATWWTEVLIAFSQSSSPPPTVGIVQNQYSYTGSTYVSYLSVTLNSEVTASNILVAMVNVEGGGYGSTFTLIDHLNNVWTTEPASSDNLVTKSDIYYTTIASTGSDTVTVNFSPNVRYAVLSVWEIAGYYAPGVIYSKGASSSGCCSVGQVSPQTNSFALAGAAVDSAGTWTGTNGFTLYAPGVDWAVEYSTAPPSPTTASMSATSSTYWSEVFISFPVAYYGLNQCSKQGCPSSVSCIQPSPDPISTGDSAKDQYDSCFLGAAKLFNLNPLFLKSEAEIETGIYPSPGTNHASAIWDWFGLDTPCYSHSYGILQITPACNGWFALYSSNGQVPSGYTCWYTSTSSSESGGKQPDGQPPGNSQYPPDSYYTNVNYVCDNYAGGNFVIDISQNTGDSYAWPFSAYNPAYAIWSTAYIYRNVAIGDAVSYINAHSLSCSNTQVWYMAVGGYNTNVEGPQCDYFGGSEGSDSSFIGNCAPNTSCDIDTPTGLVEGSDRGNDYVDQIVSWYTYWANQNLYPNPYTLYPYSDTTNPYYGFGCSVSATQC